MSACCCEGNMNIICVFLIQTNCNFLLKYPTSLACSFLSEMFVAYCSTKENNNNNFRANRDLSGYLAQGVPTQITMLTGKWSNFYDLESSTQRKEEKEEEGVKIHEEGAQPLCHTTLGKNRQTQGWVPLPTTWATFDKSRNFSGPQGLCYLTQVSVPHDLKGQSLKKK